MMLGRLVHQMVSLATWIQPRHVFAHPGDYEAAVPAIIKVLMQAILKLSSNKLSNNSTGIKVTQGKKSLYFYLHGVRLVSHHIVHFDPSASDTAQQVIDTVINSLANASNTADFFADSELQEPQLQQYYWKPMSIFLCKLGDKFPPDKSDKRANPEAKHVLNFMLAFLRQHHPTEVASMQADAYIGRMFSEGLRPLTPEGLRESWREMLGVFIQLAFHKCALNTVLTPVPNATFRLNLMGCGKRSIGVSTCIDDDAKGDSRQTLASFITFVMQNMVTPEADDNELAYLKTLMQECEQCLAVQESHHGAQKVLYEHWVVANSAHHIKWLGERKEARERATAPARDLLTTLNHITRNGSICRAVPLCLLKK